MKIILYESVHLKEAGFFRFLFQTLRVHRRAAVYEDRPTPSQVVGGKAHAGAYVQFDDKLVFFDMSDHVFAVDIEALKICDIYYKANYNQDILLRVLQESDAKQQLSKLRPFLFFPPSLPKCHLYRKMSGWPVERFMGKKDFCHIVGVYENLLAENNDLADWPEGKKLAPNEVHFWIRKFFSKIIQELSASSVSRLTSRGNQEIEDNQTVYSNVNHWKFLWSILSSRFTVLNTYPHAVYPWKAYESIALGVPFLLEQTPLIEVPLEFRLVAGEHFLEILPGFGSFDPDAALADPASYRILQLPTLKQIGEGFEKVMLFLSDKDRYEAMRENCHSFARERLTGSYLSSWLEREMQNS